jgi:DNA-binding NtrC family response regulator
MHSDAFSIIEKASSCSEKKHILLVDDELLLVEMTKMMLERIGYRVTAFTDGSEALKVFAENPDSFDLVIADQIMPGITGIAFAKEVLAMDPDMPVVICTGDSEIASQESAGEVGIREFVIKPATRKEMAQATGRALEQGEGIE